MARKVGGNTGQKAAGNRGKGRPKGAKNKVTASVKAAFAEAFERHGGVDALVKWAAGNETEFYKLCGRLIPAEVGGSLSGTVTVRFANE